MPRKTVKRGGLFGFFTTYKPDSSEPIVKSSERGFLMAMSSAKDKYGFGSMIISKDNGKSWSKIDYKKLTPSENNQYKNAQNGQYDVEEQTQWNSLSPEQKETKFRSELNYHTIWRKNSGKEPLTPDQIIQSRQRFFVSGIPNTIHAGGKGRRSRKTRRRV